jgi:hypothetical protein
MFKVFFSVMALTVSLASSVAAQDRVTLGWGRMFTNDVFGDGKDRWKTGSYTVSRIRGASWDGTCLNFACGPKPSPPPIW